MRLTSAFEQIRIGSVELPNRVVRTAAILTTHRRATSPSQLSATPVSHAACSTRPWEGHDIARAIA